jgi:uncharacterized protein (TIGR04222 family)
VTAKLGIAQAGYLARGRRRAILGALVALRVHGAVAAGRPGTIRRKGPPPSWSDPLTRAVYRGLSTPVGTRMLRARTSVREALATTAEELVTAKLLIPGWRRAILPVVLFGVAAVLVHALPWAAAATGVPAVLAIRWPRRTRAGRRAVRDLRRAHPVPGEDAPADAWGTGMVVALHGVLDLPNIAAFAVRARLRDGGVWPDRSATDAKLTSDDRAVWGGGNEHSTP